MVSSSSSADRPAARLLGAAFGVLHDEVPAYHGQLYAALERLTVHVVADGELLVPRLVNGRIVLGDPSGAPSVTLHMSLAIMLALLEARRTLVDAVTRGELDVWGSADALDAAADAFAIFLHGMVRAPSSARLMAELRSQVVGSRTGVRA